MRKQNLFYIYKLKSSRILNNPTLTLSIEESRRSGELVSVGCNQVIYSVFRILGIEFRSEKIVELKKLRKIARKEGDYNKIISIEQEIDKKLFIPEIISVSMDNKNDYDKIMKKGGFYVNSVRYVRLLCGSGHARRNTVIFVDETIEKELKEILNNDRHMTDMVLAKNNAYFALSYSGVISVSQPYFCVIPDYEIKRYERVEVILDNNEIVEEDRLIDFNLFDGQGLISPRLAQQWSEELELDYIPSAFIIRNSFLKGMVCTFDFHKYAEEVAEKHLITDVWGNSVNIRDMDLVLTASQFKAWNNYRSLNEYVAACEKNNFTFGVSRATPKQEETHVFSNYQFLQVLNLSDKQIEDLCSKTVDYFSGVLKDDINYTLLYLLGKIADREYDPDIFMKINDNVVKALILNRELIYDPYVRAHVLHSLNKKIHDAYMGNLIFDGNYSMIVQDPIAFCEHLFSLPVKGILSRGQHYNAFWNRSGVGKVASMRAPLTWRSEVNILNLVNNSQTAEWYHYLGSGVVIYNVNGCDMMIHADGDSDGDLVMTTSDATIIEGACGGLPITYDKKKAKKEIVEESKLWKIDKLSFDSRIGFITNCSTTLYAMLSKYEPESLEGKEIIRRAKICRRLQGDQIDLTKGIQIAPFPTHWTTWKKPLSANDTETIFNNSILIDKRPYFMRYLYPNYAREYNKQNENYNTYCIANFGIELDSLLDMYRNHEDFSEKQIKFLDNYFFYNPLLDSECTMNRICHYMERTVKPIKQDINITLSKHMILKDHDIVLDRDKLKAMFEMHRKYKHNKQNFIDIFSETSEEKMDTIEQYNKTFKLECMKISTNLNELANLAIEICYVVHPSDNKSFAWGVFGKELVENAWKNRQSDIRVPFKDSCGDIEFLGNRYSLYPIKTGEIDDYLL